MAGLFNNIGSMISKAGVAAEGVGDPHFFTRERDRKDALDQRDLNTLLTLAGRANPGTPEYEAITQEIINHPAIPQSFRDRMKQMPQAAPNASWGVPISPAVPNRAAPGWNWVDPHVAQGNYAQSRADQVASLTPILVDLNRAKIITEAEKANSEKSKQVENIASAGRFSDLGGKYRAEGEAATTKAKSDEALKKSTAELNAKRQELVEAQIQLQNAKTETERQTLQGKVDKLSSEIQKNEAMARASNAMAVEGESKAKKGGKVYDIKTINDELYKLTHDKNGNEIEPTESDLFALQEMAKTAGYKITKRETPGKVIKWGRDIPAKTQYVLERAGSKSGASPAPELESVWSNLSTEQQIQVRAALQNGYTAQEILEALGR